MYKASQAGLSWTADGDLDTTDSNHLKVVRGIDSLLAQIHFALRTDPGDYLHALNIGADISDVLGKSNTEPNRKGIVRKLNDYFLTMRIGYPNRITTEINKINPTGIFLTINVTGPGLQAHDQLVLRVQDGNFVWLPVLADEQEVASRIKHVTPNKDLSRIPT